MRFTRGFLVLFALSLFLSLPAHAEEETREIKTPETSVTRESDPSRHRSCQSECEKEGEDPYQCEEFCVQMASLDCVVTATVAKR